MSNDLKADVKKAAAAAQQKSTVSTVNQASTIKMRPPQTGAFVKNDAKLKPPQVLNEGAGIDTDK